MSIETGRTLAVQQSVVDGCVSSMHEFSEDELAAVADLASDPGSWLPQLVREYLNVWKEIGEHP